MYSASVDSALRGHVLVTLAAIINEEDYRDDDSVSDALCYVADLLLEYLADEEWLGNATGVQTWEIASKHLHRLQETIDRKIAEYKRAGEENEELI
jgi:hypothetical protein